MPYSCEITAFRNEVKAIRSQIDTICSQLESINSQLKGSCKGIGEEQICQALSKVREELEGAQTAMERMR